MHRLHALVIDLYQEYYWGDRVVWEAKLKQQERLMLQEGDKSILMNVAKVIAVLVVVAISLIFVASYVGGM